jgi:S1-C subfamily serine protease
MGTANTLLEFSDAIAHAVEIGAAAVAAINGRPHVPSSGILWRSDVVVTTDHTLKRDEDITVTLPEGRSVPATLAGRDGGTDIAVLRLAEKAGDGAKLAPEASVKTGNLVLALGRRSGNGISASLGVANAVGGAWKTWRGGQIDQFIRPDISIYTGFSGGALIDVEGRVIGLNTSGLTRGTGVTVPAATVSRITDEILTRGRVSRGFIGIGMHPVDLPGGGRGLVILSIQHNGPAAQAGMVIGDVLCTLNGEAVLETDAVQWHLGPGSVGKPLRATILRGGAPMELTLTPVERPAPAEK